MAYCLSTRSGLISLQMEWLLVVTYTKTVSNSAAPVHKIGSSQLHFIIIYFILPKNPTCCQRNCVNVVVVVTNIIKLCTFSWCMGLVSCAMVNLTDQIVGASGWETKVVLFRYFCARSSTSSNPFYFETRSCGEL